jgi:GT2 family glycosyltransferase
MALLIAQHSARSYPRLPLLNGFCLLIKQEVIKAIGYLDEERYGDGYGEEDDYTFRARGAGWSLALADDAYVYHAQSKSYSHESRQRLSRRSGRILAEKHGQTAIQEAVTVCRRDRVLAGIRASDPGILRAGL